MAVVIGRQMWWDAESWECLMSQRTYWRQGQAKRRVGSKLNDTRCLSVDRYTEIDCGFRPCWVRKAANRQAECSVRGKGVMFYCLQKAK